MNKTCTKCGATKAESGFTRDASREDGLFPWCRECKNENGKEYKARNRKSIAEKKRKKRIENKEALNQYERDYYRANKGRRIEQNRASRLGRIDKIKETKHKYYLANKDNIAKKGAENSNGPAKYKNFASYLCCAEIIYEGAEGGLLVHCTYCGKIYVPRDVDARNRRATLSGKQRGEARFYCSNACKQACPSYRQVTYWKSQKPATSREVSAYFRQLVLERDGWLCQRCGAGTEAELHVHHIEGAVQQPGIANDLENGITLCKECHKYVHNQDGCRYHDLKCSD